MKRITWTGIIASLFLLLLGSTSASAFDKVKFAFISDLHISLPEQKGIKDGYKLGLKTVLLTENTVAELNKIPDLDFVLVGGDLTNDAEPWNMDACRRILDGLQVPYFVVLGNHDVSLVPHEEKEQPVGLSKYAATGMFIGRSGGMEPGMSYYAHEVAKGLVLIGLDSIKQQVFLPEIKTNEFGGSIDPGQMRWLESVLQQHQGKTIMVLIHHGLASWSEGEKNNYHGWGRFRLDNAAELGALLKKYGVRLVFSGHRHISTRQQLADGIYHFVSPALATYPMRYTVYDMTPGALSWEVKNVSAPAEVWDLAKKNFLADSWWRGLDHSDTPEGNKKYQEFYEGTEMKGSVTWQ
ncbi:metallophosphoesterase family protein [Candidatus Electronema sp. PJ]|uniref:metallophosphoesterase family protein n=1 Tax=Candidatus Electronema sp. PJ TaxID=3401572 RepID=UPI003AA8D044